MLARIAREHGVPVHGATMPLKLAQLLIEFLSRPGDLVADPCAGYLTSAFAAQDTGRRWVATERMLEYLLPPAIAMRSRPGFSGGMGMDHIPSETMVA
jgi:site-specific DNA-methyltransferase (cytosine-N4-specific)